MISILAVVILSVLAVMLLGLVVYRRNPVSATNRLFMLLCVDFALWGIATYFAVHPATYASAVFWVRTVMFLAAPQAVLFFLLMYTFPRSTIGIPRYLLIFLIVLTVLAMFIAHTPLLFPSVELVAGEAPHPQPGIGMILFVPVAVGSVLAGLWVLVRKNIRAEGLQKIQLRYLLLGVSLMFTLIVLLNFVAVVAFNITSFTDYGPLFTLPFVGATAYSILRYRLMDIRLMVVRSVVFSVLVGTFFLAYGIAVWSVTRIAIARGVVLTPGLHSLAAIVAAAIAIAGYQWYRAALRQLTDRFFFQARYDARQALLGLGQKLSETIDLQRILALLTETLRDTVKVSKVLVFLRDAERGAFRPSGGSNQVSPRTLLDDAQPLVRHLKHWGGAIVRDELPLILERQDPTHDPDEVKETQTALAWLDAALVLPLVVKGELTGMLFLGDKLSGDPFSAEDLELLTILAPQAATALENARLYREAAEFGRTLEREVNRATAELRVANEQLKDTDKAKSEFLSIASHQLYTPLTAIRGYLSMIQDGDFGTVPQKLGNSLTIVRTSSERLIRLIRELLDISRIESGRLELKPESVDLVRMTEELVQELRPNAEQKGLTLIFQKPSVDLSPVVADAQRLRQVLLNTMDNAMKYTERGSVDVSLEQDGEAVIYRVRDTGRGMSKDALGRLFAKFTRLGSEGRQMIEGMGLGLYVARQIVREHHGDIWAESPGEGKGSMFFVKLPVEGSADALEPGKTVIVGIKPGETGEKAQ